MDAEITDKEQTARGLVAEWKAEASEIAKQRDQLSTRLAALTEAIQGVERVLGPEPQPGPRLEGLEDEGPSNGDRPEPARYEGQPRGVAAVRTVMSEAPRRSWRAKDVHQVMEQRGWLSPDAKHPLHGTEAAINRMFKSGELVKINRGLYRFKLPSRVDGPGEEDGPPG